MDWDYHIHHFNMVIKNWDWHVATQIRYQYNPVITHESWSIARRVLKTELEVMKREHTK